MIHESPASSESEPLSSTSASISSAAAPFAPLAAAPPPPAAPPPKDDRFDPARLRLSQDFSSVGVKKALITVPVRKPHRQAFVRVAASPELRFETAVLELKEEGETYLVDPSLRDVLALEIAPKELFLAIDRQGVLFLWPVKLPQADGRHDAWSRSAFAAAEAAMKSWVRVVANLSLGAYEVYVATADIPEPDWPSMELKEIIQIAFRDRYIDTIDHPVVRRLRGEG
jgi:hypothetical protein